MLLAGPGSGKTFTLTQRIAYLINTHHVDPSEILVITFTKAAAAQMQQRFLALCGGKHPPVTFGTFHAVFYSILKETSVCHTDSILTESEKKKILRDIIKRNRYDISTNNDMLKEILNEIDRYRNGLLIPRNLKPELFQNLYRDFSEAKEILGKIDFDDMAGKCEELFSERPDILKRYQERYRFLLIDEFQDIAPVQYRLVRMLAAPENNLFIVGDDDQSIYGFRGAKPDIMRDFLKDYRNAEVLTLRVNYRSTPQITEAALKLISVNQNRFPKEIRAENPGGIPVKTEGFETDREQKEALIRYLRQEQKNSRLKDSAVICRTAGCFFLLAEQLREAGIPCQFREKAMSIYDHSMVNDLLSYLEFAAAKRENRSRGLFFQFMNRPLRYISREAVDETADFRHMINFYRGRPAMQEEICRLQENLERIKNMPVFLAVNYIRKAMGYDAYLEEAYKNTESDYDIMQLADLIQNSAKGCRTLKEWKAIIEERREKEQESLREKSAEASGTEAVSLLTMHASKGLEYNKVFILNCNEGITPHRKARSEEEIEEERRMFYVGMTRAKKELSLMYVNGDGAAEKKGGAGKIMPPSRFLREMNN